MSTNKSMAAKNQFRYFKADEHFSNPRFEKSGLKNEDKKKKKKVITPEEKRKLSVAKKDFAKKRRQKKRRLIVRNLSFKVEEEELKKMFSKFGTIVDVSLPKKSDGKKRGFAFVQFDNFHSSIQAIKNLNFKELHGRPIAVDYALPKDKYEHNISSTKGSKDLTSDNTQKLSSNDESNDESSKDEQELESSSEDEQQEETTHKSTEKNDSKVDKVLKELEFDVESDEENEDEDSSDNESNEKDNSDDDREVKDSDEEGGDSDSEEEEEDDDDSCDEGSQVSKKLKNTTGNKRFHGRNNDTQEGKTVFVKNISFETTKESFKEAMDEFGTIEYCLLCMDPLTELPKGTAFVKFQDKDSAQKLLKKACDGSGLSVNDRRLYCDLAISKEEIRKKTESQEKQKKDNRNLRLLKEGLIMANSQEAEGVSATDMKRRNNLEMLKKQKLKNLNFFVSDVRLCIHNIPKNYTDYDLRKLFLRSAGPNAVVREARIMREFSKVDSDGKPKSKGFGFVEFSSHEHALKALQTLNNNPSTFSSQSRPIVEFSVENHLALLTKQRRKERNKFHNERTRATTEAQHKVNQDFKAGNTSQTRKSKTRRKELAKLKSRKNPQQNFSSTSPKDAQSNVKKDVKTKNKKGKNRNKEVTKESKSNFEKEFGSFRNLANMYKKKLLNKMK